MIRSLVTILLLCLTASPAFGADTCLRSVSEALSVSSEETAGPLPFDLTGTALSSGEKAFFFRDETDGIVLENMLTNDVTWSAGDLIRVRGEMTVNPESAASPTCGSWTFSRAIRRPSPCRPRGGKS